MGMGRRRMTDTGFCAGRQKVGHPLSAEHGPGQQFASVVSNYPGNVTEPSPENDELHQCSDPTGRWRANLIRHKACPATRGRSRGWETHQRGPIS